MTRRHQLPAVYDETRTVGAGQDHATIQAAVDWFKARVITGSCKIEVDAGSYDEAVVLVDLFLGAGGSLEIEGDTRALVGITYSDGSICNQNGIADGGTFNNANRCTVDTNPALDEITVSGGTVDPDFDAAGFVAGDKILVYDETAGTIVEREIASIDPGGAGNNVIEITVALAAALGADGDSICLLPNRRIERTSVGPCIANSAVRGVLLTGLFLKSHTGADCHGLHVTDNGGVLVQNCVTQVEDYGFFTDGPWTWILTDSSTACWSAWGGQRGFAAGNGGAILAYYSAAVGCSVGGYVASQHCFINSHYSLAINCTTYGYYATTLSNVPATGCTARHCGTGYYASNNSFLSASITDNNNNANGADYNPGGVVPGYFIGNGDAVIYASA